MGLAREIVSAYADLRASLEKRRYTPFTKAEYLRKLGAHVGEACYIVPTDLGTEPYLVKIGNHVAIAAEVAFHTHDGGVWVLRDGCTDLQVFGPIVIEDNCIIGHRSSLMPNVRIGRNSVVAPNSVVIMDVPENSVVMGVPARPFGSLEKYRQKCLERWAQQRPSDIKIEPGETWWTSKHRTANRDKLRQHLLTLFSDQLK
ncbi:acyltransferase [Acidobacteria bacterium AB60]|nr:acyltransferase [Acidobacteria bacterium AB60]